MADPETTSATPPASPPAADAASPPAKKRAPRAKAAPSAAPATPAAKPATKPAPKEKDADVAEAKVPKRANLPPALRTLLAARRGIDRRRPIFGRQAANRYYRIGRDGAWRRPRGLQSKQRRHYGYRAKIVRIGYRSPARVRGLVPSGFAPVLVHTAEEIAGLDVARQAAIIARGVGTRRRLILEEAARKRGLRVLNPIVKGEET
jgi:large subunit ribosomal protein L32e